MPFTLSRDGGAMVCVYLKDMENIMVNWTGETGPKKVPIFGFKKYSPLIWTLPSSKGCGVFRNKYGTL
ncbi:hypothetical protein ACOSP7_019467 [Xanthoceras sorbifolium]